MLNDLDRIKERQATVLLTGFSLIVTADFHTRLQRARTLTSEDQEEDFVCNSEEM